MKRIMFVLLIALVYLAWRLNVTLDHELELTAAHEDLAARQRRRQINREWFIL